MPIIVIELKYDSANDTKDRVEMEIPIPTMQNIQLLSAQVTLSDIDASLHTLYIELPFLNDRLNIASSRTTSDIQRRFPIYVDNSKKSTMTKPDYIFTLSDDIPKRFANWSVCKSNGDPYTQEDYTITLVFSYTRGRR